MDRPRASSVRTHVWVTGCVQGVRFRESTRREAARHGVHGWVKNLPDGRVEAVFEGPSLAVESIVAWCRRGPPSAQVENVASTEETPQGDAGFRVLW